MVVWHLSISSCKVGMGMHLLAWNLVQYMSDKRQIWSPQVLGPFSVSARSKLRLCSASHRAGYFSNLDCDWLSIVWAYSEQVTENGPWTRVNSIGPWEMWPLSYSNNFQTPIRDAYLQQFQLNFQGVCHETVIIDDYTTLVQVMASPSYMSTYDAT